MYQFCSQMPLIPMLLPLESGRRFGYQTNLINQNHRLMKMLPGRLADCSCLELTLTGPISDLPLDVLLVTLYDWADPGLGAIQKDAGQRWKASLGKNPMEELAWMLLLDVSNRSHLILKLKLMITLEM